MYFLNMLESDVPYTHLCKVMIKKKLVFQVAEFDIKLKNNKIKKAISDQLLGENNDFNFEIPWNVSISCVKQEFILFVNLIVRKMYDFVQ